MAITRNSISGREFHKFVESPTRPGEPAVEIAGTFTANVDPGPFAPPQNTDSIVRTVLANVETYEYKVGGISGTLLKTVTVTYTDNTLEELVNVVVS